MRRVQIRPVTYNLKCYRSKLETYGIPLPAYFACVMNKTNPFAAPSVPPEVIPHPPNQIRGTLVQAWRIYTDHFIVIIAAVCVIWLPLELISSYMDFYVFAPDDLRSSFKLTQFFELFVGIIATAAVISIGATATKNGTPNFSKALTEALLAWPRMWWTSFLAGLAIAVGLLLFIVPGIYLSIRLCFANAIVVVERKAGFNAFRRSFELTENNSWYIFKLSCALILLFLLLFAVAIMPSLLFPTLDTWIYDACVQLIFDAATAYMTLCFFCGYRGLSEQSKNKQADAP